MNIAFSPLLPWPVIGALAAIAVVLAVFALWRRVRGAPLRALAFALLLLALANPVVMNEQRDALSTVVAVIVDRSQSQDNPERTAMTDEALTAYKKATALDPPFPKALTKLGVLLTERKEWEEAQRVLEIGARKEPKNPANFLALGDLHVAKKKPKDAVFFYEEYLKLAPKNDRDRARDAGVPDRHGGAGLSL